ncbi:MAG: hypothetical protein IGR92_17890 [Leptolyngbyaceae cyanobacterium T60_A2020_046]|nr:hypothetical protein [Leptolyngbyaceae cyanobacterium T60_A2020_046]
MDKKQKQHRQQAAHQFIQSLNELGTVLQPDPEGNEPSSAAIENGSSPEPSQPHPSPPHPSSSPTWESALDEAAKDIEQFMSDVNSDVNLDP